MKHTCLIVIMCLLIIGASFSQTKYHTYRTSITCPIDKKELATAAHSNLKASLESMVTEGKLINYEGWVREATDKVTLHYNIPATDEKQFKDLLKTWDDKFIASGGASVSEFKSTCLKRKDSILNDRLIVFPVIKHNSSGVVDVSNLDVKPESNLDYKVVYDFVSFSEVSGKKNRIDSSEMNWGLPEVGRWINLHVANGVPKNKLKIVLAVHANAMETFFTNEAYQKKYKINNPNLAIIDELSKAGVTFQVCGQSLTWWGYKKEMLLPEAKLALTAQTIISSHQMKGFALKRMTND